MTWAVTPTRNSRKTTPVIACTPGASGLSKSGSPAGKRVVVSAIAGIQWKKKVVE